MANLNGTLDLLKLREARRVSLRGQKGIFVPTEGVNPCIFEGQKGSYLHVRVVESERDFGDKHFTHFVAASFANGDEFKKAKDTLPREELNALTPILGNLETWGSSGGGSYESEEEDDDLPADNDIPDFLR